MQFHIEDPVKIILFLSLILTALIGTLVQRARAKKRLQEIDRGERCLSCRGTQMQRQGPIARCLVCGHSYNVPQMAFIDAENEAVNLAGSGSDDALDD